MSTSIAKREIMNGRKAKVIGVEQLNYITRAQAVYELIKKYGRLCRADLCTALVHDKSDITENSIDNALLELKNNGFLVAEIGKGRENPTVYSVAEDKVYKPRAVARKVAPNDKKAKKAVMKRIAAAAPEAQAAAAEVPVLKQDVVHPEIIDGNAPVEAVAVQTQDANLVVTEKTRNAKLDKRFPFIEGLAAIDPSNPHFAEVAKDLAKRTDQPANKIVPVMFFEIRENETLMLSPAEARELYKSLHEIFGK